MLLKILTSVCFRCVHADRRGLDIAGIPMRKYSIGAGIVRDIESPLTRHPFTTISSTVLSQENVENAADELNVQKHNLQKTLPINNFPFTNTSKIETVIDEENRTLKAMPIPMNMSKTPAPFGGDLVQEIEYSFEERRLGFVLA